MKKTLIPFAALSIFAAVATSCGNNTKTWTYADGLADGELGFVTLVGEQGNVESQARTKGVKDALTKIASKLYNPKTGKLGVTVKDYGDLLCVDGKNTWNGDAAKRLLQPVLTKNEGKIDLISSNNDGMAVSVRSLNNLLPKTPIVGFDALTDACNLIKNGDLAGSVTQNGDDQGLLTLTILNNLIKGTADVTTGYTGYGKTNLEATLGEQHIYQTKISAVTATNADNFKPGAYVQTIQVDPQIKDKKLLVALYSSVDNFINETYAKALEFYAGKFGYKATIIRGADNDVSLRQAISSAKSSGEFDAYAFNMIDHDSYKAYLDISAGKPTVFFNRQPRENKVTISDLSTLTDTKGNERKNVYFVGTASGGQGEAQGKVVEDFFTAQSAAAEKAAK